MVEFKIPGVEVDLGAIAKGYALDCAVRQLKRNNIESCLINAGGQIFCLGDKFGRPWQIGVRDPRQGSLAGELEIRDKSVATSGDYEQFFIKDNRRYSHIIDPRTGYPAASGILSVTVISDQGVKADALATAIFVMGSESGLDMAGRSFPYTEVRIIEEEAIAVNSRERVWN